MGSNLYRDWITAEPETTRHVVIVERDVLIAHAEVKWKWLHHAGDRFKVNGLSGVLTYPAFRGQGFGAAVIREGTALIHDGNADIGMLGCDPTLSGFYAKAGWEPMTDSTVLIGATPHDARADDGLLMMLFVSGKGVAARPKFGGCPIYWGDDELW